MVMERSALALIIFIAGRACSPTISGTKISEIVAQQARAAIDAGEPRDRGSALSVER
jgi:hypothetical protein